MVTSRNNSFSSLFEDSEEEIDFVSNELIFDVPCCKTGELGWDSIKKVIEKSKNYNLKKQERVGHFGKVPDEWTHVFSLVYLIYAAIYLYVTRLPHELSPTKSAFYLIASISLILSISFQSLLFKIKYSSGFKILSTILNTIFILSVISIEKIIEFPNQLSTFIVLTCMIKIITLGTITDNIAIAITYSFHEHSLGDNFEDLSARVKVVMTCAIFTAILSGMALRRINKRILDNCCLLLQLKMQTTEVKTLAEATVNAHFSDDIIAWLKNDLISDSFNPMQNSNSEGSIDQKFTQDEKSNLYIKKSIENEILSEPLLFDKRSSYFTEMPQKLIRKTTTVVAIKLLVDRNQESILERIGEQEVHRIWDIVASKHKIKCVRKFGNVWLGTISFFEKELESIPGVNRNEKARNECYQTVCFACDILELGSKNGWNIICAIDFGNIIGGYIGTDINFNLIGSEVRWVLNTVDLVNSKGSGQLFISIPAKVAVNKRTIDKDKNTKFIRETFKSPFEQKIEYFILSNTFTFSSAKIFDAIYEFKALSNDISPQIISRYRLNELFEKNDSNNEKNNDAVDISEAYKDFKYINTQFYIQDIDSEFKLSIKERFGVDINSSNSIPIFKVEESRKILHNIIFKRYKGILEMLKEIFIFDLAVLNDLTNSSKYNVDVDNPVNYNTIQEKSFEIMDVLFFLPDVIKRNLLHHISFDFEFLSKLYFELKSWLCKPRNYNYKKVSKHKIYSVENYLTEDDSDDQTINETVKCKTNNTKSPNYNSNNVHFPKENNRDYNSYTSDIKLYSHNYFVLNFYYLATLSLTFTALILIDTENIFFIGPSSLYLLLSHFSDRRLSDNSYFNMFLLLVRIIAILNLPPVLFCGETAIEVGYLSIGDLYAFQLAFYYLVSILSKSRALKQIESFSSIVALILRATVVKPIFSDTIDCDVSFPVIYRMVVNMFLYYICVYEMFEYYAHFSYIIEKILVPEAFETYSLYTENMKNKILCCGPNLSVNQSIKLYAKRRYRKTSVLAIHIIATDLIPNLVDVTDTPNVLLPIYELIDKVIVDCGLLKVTEFSGMYIAAACGDAGFSSSLLHDLVSHKMKAVQALRRLQIKINEFNLHYGISIKIGLGLKQGSAHMGFLNESEFLFDITGETRDLAYAFAVNNDECDAIISAEFSAEVKKCFQSDEITLTPSKYYYDSGTVDVLRLSLNGDSKFNKGLELKDFEYQKKLGEGGYGSVHLLRNGGAEYAIKSIRRNQAGSNSKMIQRELSIFQKMNHPNVVSFKYCMILKTNVFLIMDYIAGGNLNQVLENLYRSNHHDINSLIKFWLAELVLAIEYIHSLGIIHRDIKPANIMIGVDGHLKLCDLGLSIVVASETPKKPINSNSEPLQGLSLLRKLFPSKIGSNRLIDSKFKYNSAKSLDSFSSQSSTVSKANEISVPSASASVSVNISTHPEGFEFDPDRHSKVGTPGFMAPETIQNKSYNKAVDWWAFGVTAYESVCRERLFNGKTREAIFKKITDQDIDLSKLSKASLELEDLVKRLLERDSKLRLGSEDVNQIKNHPYFSGIDWTTISTDEPAYHPPQYTFKDEGAKVNAHHRRQFYGDEDPDGKKGGKSYYSTKRKKGKRRGRENKWNLSLSISRVTIDEHPDEDKQSSEESQFSADTDNSEAYTSGGSYI